MLSFFVKLFSILFHPLLIPFYGIFIIFNSGTYFSYVSPDVKKVILSIYFISTIILPLSSAPFLIYQKLVDNWQLSNHKDRVLPIFILTICYIFAWFMLSRIQIPSLFITYIQYVAVAMIIAGLISMKQKISIHMIGMGVLTGLILGLSFSKSVDLHLFLIVAFLVSGIVGTTRLLKKDSKPILIYAGYVLGFLSVFIPVAYF